MGNKNSSTVAVQLKIDVLVSFLSLLDHKQNWSWHSMTCQMNNPISVLRLWWEYADRIKYSKIDKVRGIATKNRNDFLSMNFSQN